MKRPGTAGLLVLLAFSVPVIIELHTVFAYLGIDIPVRVYYPAALVVTLFTVLTIWLLPEGNGEQGKAAEA